MLKTEAANCDERAWAKSQTALCSADLVKQHFP